MTCTHRTNSPHLLSLLLLSPPVVDPHGQSSSQPTAACFVPASSDLISAPPIRRRKERPQVLNLTEAEMAGVLRPRPGRLDSPSNRYAGDWSGCGESYFPCDILLPPSKEEADYDDVPSEDTEAAEEGKEKPEDAEEDEGQGVEIPGSEPAELEQPQRDEVVEEEEKEEEEEERQVESDSSGNGQPLEDNEEEEEDEEEEERVCDHILPPRLPKEHTYQAYMKIQDISPVLSNRVNLRDLQESIDTLIGNLERELNKNKLNVGYWLLLTHSYTLMRFGEDLCQGASAYSHSVSILWSCDVDVTACCGAAVRTATTRWEEM